MGGKKSGVFVLIFSFISVVLGLLLPAWRRECNYQYPFLSQSFWFWYVCSLPVQLISFTMKTPYVFSCSLYGNHSIFLTFLVTSLCISYFYCHSFRLRRFGTVPVFIWILHGFLGCCNGIFCLFRIPFQILNILNWGISVEMLTIDSRTSFLASNILFKVRIPKKELYIFFPPAPFLYVYLYWISFVVFLFPHPVINSCEVVPQFFALSSVFRIFSVS